MLRIPGSTFQRGRTKKTGALKNDACAFETSTSVALLYILASSFAAATDGHDQASLYDLDASTAFTTAEVKIQGAVRETVLKALWAMLRDLTLPVKTKARARLQSSSQANALVYLALHAVSSTNMQATCLLCPLE